jgi:hypothetical protein
MGSFMEYKPVSRRKQQLGGLLIALISGGVSAWMWYTALTDGYYYTKELAFPGLVVLGLAVILFPGYREERLARGEDISSLSGLRLLTPRWWGIFVLALVVAVGNWIILESDYVDTSVGQGATADDRVAKPAAGDNRTTDASAPQTVNKTTHLVKGTK